MSRPNTHRTDERLADYFTGATEPADVSALFLLQQARASIQATQALFGGTEAAVLVPRGGLAARGCGTWMA